MLEQSDTKRVVSRVSFHREVAMTYPNDTAPVVRFEPCEAYRADGDSAFGCCTACGWLEDDHRVVAAANVTPLPVARPVERRAS
jgi:hypothetical protein